MQARGDLGSKIMNGGPAPGENQNHQNNHHGNSCPHSLRFIGRVRYDAGIGAAPGLQGVFGDQAIFVEAQIPCDRANKSAIEDSARQLFPLFAFEGFEEARRNACGD